MDKVNYDRWLAHWWTAGGRLEEIHWMDEHFIGWTSETSETPGTGGPLNKRCHCQTTTCPLLACLWERGCKQLYHAGHPYMGRKPLVSNILAYKNHAWQLMKRTF